MVLTYLYCDLTSKINIVTSSSLHLPCCRTDLMAFWRIKKLMSGFEVGGAKLSDHTYLYCDLTSKINIVTSSSLHLPCCRTDLMAFWCIEKLMSGSEAGGAKLSDHTYLYCDLTSKINIVTSSSLHLPCCRTDLMAFWRIEKLMSGSKVGGAKLSNHTYLYCDLTSKINIETSSSLHLPCCRTDLMAFWRIEKLMSGSEGGGAKLSFGSPEESK